MFFCDPAQLSCCSAFLTNPSGWRALIQPSHPLNSYFSQQSHGHFTTEHRELVLFVLKALELWDCIFFCLFSPWHCSSVPKPTSSVKVPVRPGEDEDGERRGRTGGKLQRFRKPRGGRERLEKGRHSLKWIWGKKGKAWGLGGLGEFAGKKGRKSLAVHVDRNTQQQGAGIGLKCSGIGKPNGVWAKAR